MTIQAILFDLWETLIHDAPELAYRRYWRADEVQKALAACDYICDGETVDRALGQAMRQLATLQDEGRDLAAGGRAALFYDELEPLSGSRPPEKALPGVEEAITSMPEHLRPWEMPGAVEMLCAVKSLGLRTGLVSNAGFTSAPHLRAMIDAYGMLPYLDAQVFSDEEGVAKPNPAIFQAALDALGLDAADCVFVGDSPHNDIAGAQALGMFAVKIGRREIEDVKPQLRIEALSELLPALERAGLLPSAVKP